MRFKVLTGIGLISHNSFKLMMMPSNGNIFRVTGPLWGESTGHRHVDSPLKGQWRGALIFSLICALTNIWANNRDADDLRRHRDIMTSLLWVEQCHSLNQTAPKHRREPRCSNSCYGLIQAGGRLCRGSNWWRCSTNQLTNDRYQCVTG